MLTSATSISILGCGWLGLPLASHFADLGFKVKASSRSEAVSASLRAMDIEHFVIDLNRLQDNIHDFLDADVLVINIPSKDIAAFDTLLDHVASSKIKNLLFVSSTSVYQATDAPINEDNGHEDRQHPLVTIENMCRQVPSVETTIVRFAGLAGPGRDPGRFFRNGKVLGSPNTPVNLIHQDDCLGIIEQIVCQDIWGEVFNACADTHPDKRSFYTKAAERLGYPAPACVETDTGPGKEISNSKLKRHLGYRFKYPDVMSFEC